MSVDNNMFNITNICFFHISVRQNLWMNYFTIPKHWNGRGGWGW